MTVKIPTNFIPEREYTLGVILGYFLGLDFVIEREEKLSDYIFILPNGKQLEIKDSFFSHLSSKKYLEVKNIPQKIQFAKNELAPEEDILILYGTDYFSIEKNKIICGNDIFAASFFMLSRWEEYVIKEKDRFGRFPEEKALSIKCKFNHRPIVNEYTEMLWNMLHFLGCKQTRKIQKYELKVTHDIDFFKRYDTLKKIAKAIAGDIFHRRSLKLVINTLISSIKIKLNIEKDTFDTFDYFMQISEKHNIKSYFYFISANTHEKETTYNIFSKQVQKTIKAIQKRKHIIGIHAGWNSFNKINILKKEITNLEDLSLKITEGRQHYLRFELPLTWQNWENSHLKDDSSLGFSKNIGFRAGTCFTYKAFNILTRKELKLTESPLVAMDTALKHRYARKELMFDNILSISKTIQKYNGTFVLLWHNNNINSQEWRESDILYEKIIENISPRL